MQPGDAGLSANLPNKHGRSSGRSIGLSIARRMVTDYMWAARAVPTVWVKRQLSIAQVAAARQRHPERPAWPTIFAKAFALAAAEIPQLRRAYIRLPWPHIHEYADSTVSILTERQLEDDTTIIPVRFRSPDTMALVELSRMMRLAVDTPLEATKFNRMMIGFSRLPFFLRRPVWWLSLNIPRMRRHTAGTFAISSAAPLNAELGRARTPISCLLTYGPLDAKGTLAVRLNFDHRIFDGLIAARALGRIEEILNTSILDELKGPGRAPRTPSATRLRARGRRRRRAS